MKEVVWNPKAKETLKELSVEVRKEIGLLLLDLQHGETLRMPFSKPMPSLGIGCHELRVKDSHGIYRAFYYAKLEDRILVFHVFQKKVQKTSIKDMEQGKRNLRKML